MGGKGVPAAVAERVRARVEDALFVCGAGGGVEEGEEPLGVEGVRVGVPLGVARDRPG